MFCSCALLCRHHLQHLGQRRRPPPLLHTAKMQAKAPGGSPMVRRHPRNSFPSHSDRTCAATRGRHGHTSGRESRGSGLDTPAPGRTQGEGRTRGGTARPPRRAEGGGARGRAEGARAARVELSSILGGLTARSRGTPAHLRQSLHLPTLHLGWKAAPRRLV
jgi:hypothetical protein